MEHLARPAGVRPGHRLAPRLRTPLRRLRALGAPPRGRHERHLEVPEELLRLIELGSRVPGFAAAGYWDLVEDHIAAWVHRELPPGARDVSVIWNEDLWEVVISWNPRRRTG